MNGDEGQCDAAPARAMASAPPLVPLCPEMKPEQKASTNLKQSLEVNLQRDRRKCDVRA
jgi:hypothetical protein